MANNYFSDLGPNFRKTTLKFKPIPAYAYDGTLAGEYKAKKISKAEAAELYESMLVIREFEEMILKCRTGAYEIISDYEYRGPTHLSIGQEATAAGVCSELAITDLITSTHRGHGDSIAKGFHAIKHMSEEELHARCPEFAALSGEELREAVMEDHIFRTIAELFGKEAGYGKGRGGGMHIADFRVGHLGANAIVGGGIPIATGAAMTCRIDEKMKGRVVCSFAGDGAYSNGVVLESLNWASQDQFNGPLAKTKFGLPIIYCLINNHYGMTGRADGEVTGVDHLARRAAGFDNDNMHAEVVNGMDIMAVRDAIVRAREIIEKGEGPVLLEFDTYRYYGHSLSDPRNEYRTREEEARWKEVDPVETFRRNLLEAKIMTEKELKALEEKVAARNARAARRAADAPDPDPADVIKYMYTDGTSDVVPEEYAAASVKVDDPAPRAGVHHRVRGLSGHGHPRKKARGRRKIAAPLRRRRGRIWRRLQALQGDDRHLRPRPGLQHPDLRSVHLRRRGRHGDDRLPADRGAHVHGLRPDVLRPDLQPGRQVALHDRRLDRGSAGDPVQRRRRQRVRRAALAVARIDVRAHSRHLRRLPVEPL